MEKAFVTRPEEVAKKCKRKKKIKICACLMGITSVICLREILRELQETVIKK